MSYNKDAKSLKGGKRSYAPARSSENTRSYRNSGKSYTAKDGDYRGKSSYTTKDGDYRGKSSYGRKGETSSRTAGDRPAYGKKTYQGKPAYTKEYQDGHSTRPQRPVNSHDPYVQRGVSPYPKARPQTEVKKPAPEYTRTVEETPVEREEDATLLVGRNAVWEALKAGRSVERLYVAQGVDESTLQGVLGVAYREKVKVERIPRPRVTELAGTDKHQGVIAYLSAMEYTPLEKLLDDAFKATDKPIFILLDEVQDPHNLGAIIRTADCAGANGIIILEHRAVGLTATVAKVSAGALSHMPVAKVTNLVRAMEQLQERGVTLFGADMGGASCYESDFSSGPLGLVIGNEGVGLRRLVREQCDSLVGIPIYGHVDSLNASVAAAVLMFEAVRQRKFLK